MSIRFGTDGWRAIIGWDFTAQNVRACARGVALYLNDTGAASRGLVVGYDTRFASDDFAAEVAGVTAASGVPTLLCVRAAPTPVVSYNMLQAGAGGGVIITASHNPPRWSGFKFRPAYGGSAAPEVVEAIERNAARALEEEVPFLELSQARAQGLVKELDPEPGYLDQVARLVDLASLRSSGLRVVCDAMFGAGAGYLPQLLAGGSLALTELHGEPNPNFPGMAQPEPVAHNLTELCRQVVARQADVGLALDGDADRLGLVDEKGRFISTLTTYAILVLYLLEVCGERGPLVKSTTTSAAINRLGELYGVPVHETPVGFKYLGPTMVETQALAAGEESGGYAFRGHLPERDGILSALFCLDLMVRTGKRPSELVEWLEEKVGPHHYQRWDIPFPPERRFEVEGRVASQEPDTLAGRRVTARDKVDGHRLWLEGGAWTIIRFSGTEPLLRLYAEAESPEATSHLLEAARELAGV